MEVLVSLICAAGPVRPTSLAASLMLERSTISRNLALMQNRGWVAVAETSATGRAMSVTITDAGIAAFTSAGPAWRRAQADATRMLGPDAAPMLDQWLGLDAATPAGGSDAKAQDNPGAEHEQGKAATAGKELGLPALLPSDR
jgi:DNA-binding MarR family transcriptional regulator